MTTTRNRSRGRPRSYTVRPYTSNGRTGFISRPQINGTRHTLIYWCASMHDAERRLREDVERLQSGTSPDVVRDAAKALPTLRQAITHYIDHIRAAGKVIAVDREQRLDVAPRGYLTSQILDLRIDQVQRSHVTACLQEAIQRGRSKRTISHIRTDFSALYTWLGNRYDGIVSPVLGFHLTSLSLPRQRPATRSVPSDEELRIYMGYIHKSKAHRIGVVERQVATAIARYTGGLRCHDLRDLRWGVDLKPDDDFTTIVAPRLKTQAPQIFFTPLPLRHTVYMWWRLQGAPTSGYVFPVRKSPNGIGSRGSRVGGKKEQGWAQHFRQDLMAAFRAAGPDSGAPQPTDERWTDLFVGRETDRFVIRRTDFHSLRRAWTAASQRLSALDGERDRHARSLTAHSTSDMTRLYTAHSGMTPEPIPAAWLPEEPLVPAGLPLLLRQREGGNLRYLPFVGTNRDHYTSNQEKNLMISHARQDSNLRHSDPKSPSFPDLGLNFEDLPIDGSPQIKPQNTRIKQGATSFVPSPWALIGLPSESTAKSRGIRETTQVATAEAIHLLSKCIHHGRHQEASAITAWLACQIQTTSVNAKGGDL